MQDTFRRIFCYCLWLISSLIIAGTVTAQSPPRRFDPNGRPPKIRNQSRLLNNQADQQLKTNAFKAIELAQAALEQAQATSNIIEEVRALITLSTLYLDGRFPDKALVPIEKALTLALKTNHKRLQLRAYQQAARVNRFHGNLDRAIDCFQKAIQLSEEMGEPGATAFSLNGLGILYKNSGQPQKAIDCHRQSLRIREELNDQIGISTTLHNLGTTYSMTGDFAQSLEYHLKALKLNEASGDQPRIAASLQAIGIVYGELDEGKKALDYLGRALTIFEQLNDVGGLADTQNNLGLIYFGTSEYEKALNSLNQAIRIYQEMGRKPKIARGLNNMGLIYLRLNQKEKALSYFQQALETAQTINDMQLMAAVMENMAVIFGQTHQEPKAEAYFQQALSLAESTGERPRVRNILRDLSEFYETRKNYDKALEYVRKMIGVQETIASEESSKRIEVLQARFESEKKEKEIELLHRSQEIQELEIARQSDHIEDLQREQELKEISIASKEREVAVLERDRQIQALNLANTQHLAKQQAQENHFLRKEAELNSTIRTSLAGAFGSAVLLIVALSNLYFVKKRSEHKLQLKNAEITNQKTVVEEQAAALEQANQELDAQRQALLDANLKLRELDQLKANFTAMLVHDLKSPLSVVKASLEIFETDKEVQNTSMLPLVNASHRSVEKVLSLISEVLEVFRSESQDMKLHCEPLETRAFLQECLEEVRVAGQVNQIQVETDIAAQLPPVKADASKLGRVLSNLLSNAVKFTPRQGTVRLAAKSVVGSGVEEGMLFVEVAVSDTGEGIPAEEIPYLFDPYRQVSSRKAQLGVGLGLAIVKRIVAAHGGNIAVQSQPGVGSCFTIRLPAFGAK
ncbi:MAG: tetratricopeptide repeat protein [Acidobacteria bacterium]|nr:tetratricopeptide repeat protein [Acidobacteriota bacterium]